MDQQRNAGYRRVTLKRRDLIALLVSAAVGRPLAARAQQKAPPVVGFLGSTSPGGFASYVAAFRQGLSETGYVDGRNVSIEYRWAEDHHDRLPGLAADLIDHKVDVIATSGGPLPTSAAKNATSTIPIVFAVGGDPVEGGLVGSLARPGGNVTGVTFIASELIAKRLELLTELVPQAGMVALLVEPNNPRVERIIRDAQEAARAKGVQLRVLSGGTESEIDAAFDSLSQLHVGALLVSGGPFFTSRRGQLVALASRYAVPVNYDLRDFVTIGGLMSYGASIAAAYRQAGVYAGRILKGAKPADLPIMQPTKFELVINLRTAKRLGLTIPQSILARADEVIE